MHLVYIDDSKDKPIFTFSAIVVPSSSWAELFAQIKAWRRSIRDSDGVYLARELHATEFTAGRGKIAPKVVLKGRRCQIFREALKTLSALEKISLFNVSLHREDWAFERLLNRINRTMQAWDSHAILICDEGKEAEYTKLIRKMGVYNPIPSKFGYWLDTGDEKKNIPLDRIIEDPFFRDSARSYFVQMADFCAYALLRFENPLESKERYGLNSAFKLLKPICFKQANPADPYGIIR